MLVEHRFVTTLESSEALDAVEEIVGRLGFAVEQRTDEKLIARRGKTRAAKAKVIRDLPQRLQVEYDRGGVTLAVSLEPSRKPGEIHRDMLLTISNVLEAALARGASLDDALDPMRDVDERIDREARRHRVRVAILLTALFLSIAALIVVAATVARP